MRKTTLEDLLNKLDYDMICTNSATGWVFPVKIKERTECSMK